MNVPAGRDAAAVRLVALAALAGFCAFHWANLLTDPPVARVLLAVAIAAGTAASLDWLGRRPRPAASLVVAALAISVAGIAAGLVAVGLAPRLLAPGGWDRLADGVGRGIVELGDVTYPYDGPPGWPRLAVLLALPVLLGLATALAFWPAHRRERRLRAMGLGVLIATYGIAVVLYAPGLALLHGFVLLGLIGVWLWAPRVAGRRAAIAAVAIAVAGGLAVPVAGAVDRSSPLLDYRSWSWTGATPSVEFEWNHSYEPLDWPREGTALLDVRSESPHYWRAVVLERFDGFRWVRSEAADTALELPNQAESGYSAAHREWFESTEVTVRDLRSGLVVGPGSVQTISGLAGSIASDGTALAGEVPVSGQRYRVTSYAPDPSAAQMRAAPGEYAEALTRFTQLDLPTERIPITSSSQSQEGAPTERRWLVEPLAVPLRGEPLGAAAEVLRGSGYGEVFELARELTRDAPTTYDAVRAVERRLQRGYTYTEAPPHSEYPLRSFLLSDRAGYCQQFSGAMALILRMNGIPARVVSGFSPGVHDPDQEGVFTVRDTDAHSWTEVYFMGIGWVPFDATPPASPARSQTTLNAIAATPGDVPGGPSRGVREPEARAIAPGGGTGGVGLPSGALAALGALLGVGGLAIVVLIGRRRLRFRALSPSERAEAQVRELASAFAGTRYRSRNGATLMRLERQLRGSRRPAAAAYTSRLRASRFAPAAGAGPGLRERRAARRELAASRGLRGRLRLLWAMPPGGPATTQATHLSTPG